MVAEARFVAEEWRYEEATYPMSECITYSSQHAINATE